MSTEWAAYRTEDVISYWRDLESRGCHQKLAVELYWLPRRVWHGPGMRIDVAALERWMARYRKRLQGGPAVAECPACLARRLAEKGVVHDEAGC